MAKTAQDIVNNFIKDTGLYPESEKERQYCLNFGNIILAMEKDKKAATISSRHVFEYASKKGREWKNISQGTFYNNTTLRAMMDWAIAVNSEGGTGVDPQQLKELKQENKALRKKIEGLIQTQQKVDDIYLELQREQEANMRLTVINDRAMAILKQYGLDKHINTLARPQDIMQSLATGPQLLVLPESQNEGSY